MEPYRDAVNVGSRSGDEEDPRPLVSGAHVTGAQSNRQAGIPEIPEGAPHDGHVTTPCVSDVLDHNPSWLELTDNPPHLVPESRAGAFEPGALARGGEILTGKPAAEHVYGGQVVRPDVADVVEAGHVGPMLRQDVPTVAVALDLERDATEAGALKAEIQAADAGEEGADQHARPPTSHASIAPCTALHSAIHAA